MQDKSNRFRPLCICRSLLDFIFNNLISRGGFKSVALDHPPPQSSSQNQVPDCSENVGNSNNGVASGEEQQQPESNHESLIKEVQDEDDDQHDWDLEIQVNHKETHDLEYWTPVDNLGSSIYLCDDHSNKKKITLPKVSFKEKERQLERIQETPAIQESKDSKEPTAAKPRLITRTKSSSSSSGTKKMMSSIKDLARGDRSSSAKKQGKSSLLMKEKLTLAVEAEDHMEAAPPVRQVRPLFNVAMSINEKSDAFIRSRKAAMRGSYDFDT